MLEITRELVEHYLRATGWALTNGEWRNAIDPTHYDRFPSSWLDDIGLDTDVAIRMTGHSDNLPLLAFRLGLCAAAEEDFALEKAIGHSSNSDADRSAAHGLSGIAHLRDAGIEYLAWESARKR